MTGAALVSEEEYLHTSYEPDLEYRDGVVVGRNVGTQLRGLLQTIVGAYLHQLRRRFQFRVFTETRLRLGASGRYYVPDVMVVEQPYARGKVVTDVPAVVFEIKSPDDKLDEVFEKCLDYASFGIPNIVVLDPDRRRQYVFSNNALQLVTSVVLRLPKSGVDLPFPADEMFAEMEED